MEEELVRGYREIVLLMLLDDAETTMMTTIPET
jgi:hypothetical protein